jgi:hypothetical protein
MIAPVQLGLVTSTHPITTARRTELLQLSGRGETVAAACAQAYSEHDWLDTGPAGESALRPAKALPVAARKEPASAPLTLLHIRLSHIGEAFAFRGEKPKGTG